MSIAVILLVLALILAIVALFLPAHAFRLLAGSCISGFLAVILITGAVTVS